MPDSPTPTQGQSTPQGQPQQTFQMPEKFAGKSAEDIARSYVELERAHSTAAERAKAVEAYTKLGTPEQLSEAIAWARDAFQKRQAGEWIDKGAQKAAATKAEPSGSTLEPWSSDDWAYKSPGEQAKALSDYQIAQTKAYIDQVASGYGEQIKGLAGRDQREKNILLRAISTAIKNPGIDPEAILNEAGSLASKNAEELIDMVLQMRQNSPEAQERQLNDKIAQAVAAERQKWEAAQQEDFFKQTAPPKTRLQALKSQSREDELRQIQQSLAKQGIRFS